MQSDADDDDAYVDAAAVDLSPVNANSSTGETHESESTHARDHGLVKPFWIRSVCSEFWSNLSESLEQINSSGNLAAI